MDGCMDGWVVVGGRVCSFLIITRCILLMLMLEHQIFSRIPSIKTWSHYQRFYQFPYEDQISVSSSYLIPAQLGSASFAQQIIPSASPTPSLSSSHPKTPSYFYSIQHDSQHGGVAAGYDEEGKRCLFLQKSSRGRRIRTRTLFTKSHWLWTHTVDLSRRTSKIARRIDSKILFCFLLVSFERDTISFHLLSLLILRSNLSPLSSDLAEEHWHTLYPLSLLLNMLRKTTSSHISTSLLLNSCLVNRSFHIRKQHLTNA